MLISESKLRQIIRNACLSEVGMLPGPSTEFEGGSVADEALPDSKERCCVRFRKVEKSEMPDDWAGPPPYYVDACGNPRGEPVYHSDGTFLYSCSWSEGAGDFTTAIKRISDETGFSDVVHLVASVAPGTGDAMDAAEVHRILTTEPENYGGLGMAMFGFIPLLGDLSKGFKAAKKAGNVAETKKVSDEIMKHSEDIAAAAKKRRTIAKSSTKIRSAKAIASKIPWADKQLWILQGQDRARSGAHQVVALKDKSGKTHMFYKSSGTNEDEFGKKTSKWLHLNAIALKDNLIDPATRKVLPPMVWFVKTAPGAKANPQNIQHLADQLDDLDRVLEGPGIAFITKHLPDFKIKSISDNFSQQGVSDIAKLNQWADELGAIGAYGMKQPLPGINLTMAQAVKKFKVPA